MALTNEAYFNAQAKGVGHTGIVINAASGNDRIFVSFGLQRRASFSLTNPTLNGASPTGTATVSPLENGNAKLVSYYWVDADLPATSGTYTLSHDGPDANALVGGYYAEGASQAAPAGLQTNDTGSGTSQAFTVTAVAGSRYFMAIGTTASGDTVAEGASQTVLIDEGTVNERQVSRKADGSLSYTISPSATFVSFAFAVEPAGATQSITSINGGSTLANGSTSNSLVVSGFTETVTSITISDGTNTTLATNISGSDPNYTFDVPDLTGYTSDTAGCPLTTGSYSITAVAAGATETSGAFSITYNPKSGYAVVETLSADKDISSVFKDFPGLAPTDASQVVYPTANNTSVAPNGDLTSDQVTGSIAMDLWDVDDGNFKQFDVILSEDSSSPFKSIRNAVSKAIRKTIRNPVR